MYSGALTRKLVSVRCGFSLSRNIAVNITFYEFNNDQLQFVTLLVLSWFSDDSYIVSHYSWLMNHFVTITTYNWLQYICCGRMQATVLKSSHVISIMWWESANVFWNFGLEFMVLWFKVFSAIMFIQFCFGNSLWWPRWRMVA